MIRCALLELFFPGAGYALTGHLRAAALSIAAMVGCVAVCLTTPWALYALLGARLAAALDAGRRGRPGDRGWNWRAMLLVGSVGSGTLVLARLEVIEAFEVPSESMSPTIVVGDRFLVDKLTVRWRAPERGEVIAFHLGRRVYVKRVIGLAGDEIVMRGGVLRVNDAEAARRPAGPDLFEERHGGHRYRTHSDDELTYPDVRDALGTLDCGGPVPTLGQGTRAMELTGASGCRVPPGCVFVLGDNRVDSADSRSWGAVPIERVIGRVVGVE